MRRAVPSLAVPTFAGLVIAAGLGLSLVRVAELAAEEVDRLGEPVAAGDLGTQPLVRAELSQGQRALFEVCAEGLETGWEDVAFEVWHLGDGALAQRVEHDAWAPRMTASDTHACVVAVRWDSVLVGGEYGLRVAGRARGEEGRVSGRVAAWRDRSSLDRFAVGLVFAGGLLLLLGLALRGVAPGGMASSPLGEPAVEAGERRGLGHRWIATAPWVRVSVALVLLLVAMVGLSALRGTALGLVRALSLALVEVGLAVTFVQVAGERSRALGLGRPRPGWWILIAAPVVGFALWIAGAWLSRWVPSTGLSPVEAFVSHPSGSLALAAVAVIVPIAEELFFRGFVFGALAERHGAWVATAVTAVLFALIHLPQQWGAWGPFVAVATTGLLLTGLRAATGSTIVSTVAHLTHNGLITLLALA